MNSYTYLLLIWDTSWFCRESRANPPPSDPGPRGGTGPPHAKICTGNPALVVSMMDHEVKIQSLNPEAEKSVWIKKEKW